MSEKAERGKRKAAARGIPFGVVLSLTEAAIFREVKAELPHKLLAADLRLLAQLAKLLAKENLTIRQTHLVVALRRQLGIGPSSRERPEVIARASEREWARQEVHRFVAANPELAPPANEDCMNAMIDKFIQERRRGGPASLADQDEDAS